METPITELRNEQSANFDASLNPTEFLRTLRSIDAQIFSGWGGGKYSSLLDPDIISQCDGVACRILDLLHRSERGESVGVAMSGCGTSGRAAYLISAHFNKLMINLGKKPIFHYLVSGGDSALLFSDELPEDDAYQGAEDVKSFLSTHGRDGGMLIGVTCGLSAPYVAGQLDYMMDVISSKTSVGTSSSSYSVSVIGFNPVHLSRNVPIEKIDGHRSFRDILVKLENNMKRGNHFIINPVVRSSCCLLADMIGRAALTL